MCAFRYEMGIVVRGQKQLKTVASTITLVLEVCQEWATSKFFFFFDALEHWRHEGKSGNVVGQPQELRVQFCNDGPELVVVFEAKSTANTTAAVIILEELILHSPCQCPEKTPATWNHLLDPHLFCQSQP